MNLLSFLSRYTAPVAAVVREGITAGSGFWRSIENEEGETHIFINAKGLVTKGSRHLIGAHAGHLPHEGSKNHPVGHVPAGAKDHPSYTEHPSSQPKPKAEKPEGAQESAIKSPGKPYARLHGADQGKGASAAEKGAQGASASAEGAHSAHEGPEPLTKEQSEAGLATARAESVAASGKGDTDHAPTKDEQAYIEKQVGSWKSSRAPDLLRKAAANHRAAADMGGTQSTANAHGHVGRHLDAMADDLEGRQDKKGNDALAELGARLRARLASRTAESTPLSKDDSSPEHTDEAVKLRQDIAHLQVEAGRADQARSRTADKAAGHTDSAAYKKAAKQSEDVAQRHRAAQADYKKLVGHEWDGQAVMKPYTAPTTPEKPQDAPKAEAGGDGAPAASAAPENESAEGKTTRLRDLVKKHQARENDELGRGNYERADQHKAIHEQASKDLEAHLTAQYMAKPVAGMLAAKGRAEDEQRKRESYRQESGRTANATPPSAASKQPASDASQTRADRGHAPFAPPKMTDEERVQALKGLADLVKRSGAKDTPKPAYTAPQAAGQGAGAAAPESSDSRDAKVDRAFHEGAAKATGGLGEEVRPLDRNIHGMAAMLKAAGAGDVSPMDAYQHYYNGDVLNASDGLTPTQIRKGMEHHAKGMAEARQREMGYMGVPDTSNAEYRAERHGGPEQHAREIFDTQFKAKYPSDRLRSKNYNEKWAQLHNTALSMAHSNIAQAHDDAATTIERDAARNGPDERMRNGLESAKTVARHAKALNPESEGAKALDDYSTAMDARLKSHDDASKAAVKRLRDKAAHHRAEAQRHAALHNAGKGAVREAFTLTPRIGGYSAPTSMAAR